MVVCRRCVGAWCQMYAIRFVQSHQTALGCCMLLHFYRQLVHAIELNMHAGALSSTPQKPSTRQHNKQSTAQASATILHIFKTPK